MTIDPSSLSHLRGQKRTINADRYAQKLGQLRRGEVRVSPAVEASYKELYKNQPHQSLHRDYQDTQDIDDTDYSLLRTPAPSYDNPVRAEAPAPQVNHSIKLGAIFEFAKDKGDIQITCDDKGFEYSCGDFIVSSLEFAKGDSVPSRLKRKFKANQLYSVADVSIDLADIADTFQPGDSIKFNVKEVKCFYQRHSTDDLASNLKIEAEIKTDVVDIPAVIQLKAHPLTKDLLSYTMQEILIAAQVDEIIDIIES